MKTIKFCLLTLLFTFLTLRSFAQIIISSDTTWATPQVFNESVIVNPGVTLTIEAWVNIDFAHVDVNLDGIGELAFEVQGKLVSLGTQCKPIKFGAVGSPVNGPQHWKGVHINSGSVNDSLYNLEIEFADSGLWIESPATVTGGAIHDCVQGLSILNSVTVAVSDFVSSHNQGTGIANYGGTLTLHNSGSISNGRFGLTNHGGDLVADSCTLDSNAWGGVYLGSGTSDIQYSNIRENVGAGVEVSEWRYWNDFDTAGTKSVNPTVVVNQCNIFNNANTEAEIPDSLVRNMIHILVPWGTCTGGYPSLNSGECRSTVEFEVPFGSFDELRPEVSHLVKHNVTPNIHYQFNYKLRRDYDDSVIDNFITTSAGFNCLGSVSIRHQQEPSNFTVTGYTDKYNWEVCAITHLGVNLMRPTLRDGFYTMKAGSFEVSSTVLTMGSAFTLSKYQSIWT